MSMSARMAIIGLRYPSSVTQECRKEFPYVTIRQTSGLRRLCVPHFSSAPANPDQPPPAPATPEPAENPLPPLSSPQPPQPDTTAARHTPRRPVPHAPQRTAPADTRTTPDR